MKSVVVHRIAIIMSAVLLVAGLVAYQYLYHLRHTQPVTTSLFALVPDDAFAVVETEDVASFVNEFGDAVNPQLAVKLPVSDLYNCLKDFVGKVVETTPHGLNPQISKMLLSYHQPEGPLTQVLYFHATSDDAALLANFLDTYQQRPYEKPETLRYKGEEISVYQLADGHTLAVYITDNYLAVSFRSDLLKNVIEAQLQSATLSDNPAFMNMQEGKSAFLNTAVYLRTDNRWEQVYQ